MANIPATVTYFLTRYPTFGVESELPPESIARIQFWLDDTLEEINSDVWGSWMDRGHAARAAHSYALELANQSSEEGDGEAVPSEGNLASKTIGDVSYTYKSTGGGGDSSNAIDDWLRQTDYGLEFLRMAQIKGRPAASVVLGYNFG